MLLACDVGNTNVVVGVFDGADLVGHWRLAAEAHRTADGYAAVLLPLLDAGGLSRDRVDGAVVSSVVPPLRRVWREVARRYFGVEALVVSAQTVVGLTIDYPRPEEIGADRLANAVAARAMYEGDLIVVDFGTAVTFCAVTADGRYLGGAICPGLGIAAEALFSSAALLSPVSLEGPVSPIGSDTAESIRSGLLLGYASLVDGMVERIRKVFSSDAVVIASGGWAELVSAHSATIRHVEPHLTLQGLRIIHEANRAG